MLVRPTIRAYITNLGKYNEGKLVGMWHDFPTTKEEITQTFKAIGIDGINYEEFFITDYETEIEGIYDYLSEYASINELNYLAEKIQDMTRHDCERFESAIQLGEHCDSLKSLINLTDNLDCFDYLDGVCDNYDLGYYWLEESGCYDTKSMGFLHTYFDYERFGRDISLEESGVFTHKGYIRSNGESFNEEYDGVNIPDEYKVFSLPKAKVLTKKLY